MATKKISRIFVSKEASHRIDMHSTIVIIGDPFTGKTNIVSRLKNNEFSSHYNPTGTNKCLTSIYIDTNYTFVELQLYDTVNDFFLSNLSSCYVLIVYSIDNLESFINVKKWFKKVAIMEEFSIISRKIILIGNKCDLSNERKISKEQGKKLKNELGMDYFFEVSAKTGYNISDIFDYIALQCTRFIRIPSEEVKIVELFSENERTIKDFKNEESISSISSIDNNTENNNDSESISGYTDSTFCIIKCENNTECSYINYFCKTHEKLCCKKCMNNNKSIDNKICDIYCIDKLKEKLKNNIDVLENISNKLNQSIKEAKSLFEEIDKSKEEVKSKIQSIFAKIRNTFNYEEKLLLKEVDDLFKEKEIINKSEVSLNELKKLIEESKSLDNELKKKDDILISSIKKYFNIENIKDITNEMDSIELELKNLLKNSHTVKLNLNEDIIKGFYEKGNIVLKNITTSIRLRMK
jgi:small GTP-binding protein